MKRAIARLAAVLALAVLAAFPLSAQSQTLVPTPHPLAMKLAAATEPLPLDDLVDATLAFSGVSDAGLPAYRRKLFDLVAGFQQQAAGNPDPAALGARALEHLHEGVLRRYDVRQARVDVLLDEGIFNCVSSSVLYLVLARSVGLAVGGVRTADHAFCTVKVGASTVDVEITNPYGYNPGSRKEFTDSFGRVTGFAYVPPSNYRDRTAIGERGLLSLILYDRVSFAIERGDHASALEPAVTAWTLSGDTLSRTTLVTALSNYAVWLGQSERFTEAVSFLEEAERSYGADPDLTQRRRELLHNQAVALVEAGDLDAAEALLTSKPRADLLEAGDRRELLVWVIQLRADRSARKAEYTAAAAVIADGISSMGSEPLLLAAFEVYTHNAFAQLYNARRFNEAKTFLESALARYPGSRVIRQDLDATLKALK
ncbi:MAG: tetratricopeptide repeat protein [Spirochaetes bacterium]|nr:tetratricopeptide repeat protein [Spirochaetota bacterium]